MESHNAIYFRWNIAVLVKRWNGGRGGERCHGVLMQSYAPYYVYIYGDYGTEWNLRSGLLLRREINKSRDTRKENIHCAEDWFHWQVHRCVTREGKYNWRNERFSRNCREIKKKKEKIERRRLWIIIKILLRWYLLSILKLKRINRNASFWINYCTLTFFQTFAIHSITFHSSNSA